MIKVVFFATPEIALKTFEELVRSEKYDVKALVTQPPKAKGRGKKIVESEVKKLALSHNIKILEPHKISKEPNIMAELKAMEADFFITFAFGQILSQEVLEIPKYGTINLHASLLPKYRGADPIRACLLSGECKTGITTMLTVLELDAGDICLSEEIEICEDTNSIELTELISKRAPKLIQDTMDKIFTNELMPAPQKHGEATYTKKITKAEKEIDWHKSACHIHNKIRALVDNYTTQSVFGGKIIKFMKSAVRETENNVQSGEILEISKDGILVKCSEGALLLKEVKPEGKKTMSAYNWSLGSGIKKGDKFGR